MQVILLEDIPNVGKKYEEHEVADGYGMNYLLPQGLAQVANEQTRSRYEKKREEMKKQRQKQREEKAEALAGMDSLRVTITAKAGDQGQLFAGVYPEDIAQAVSEEVSITINENDVVRDQPLQKVGEYEVEIQILDESVMVTIAVEAE